MEKYLNRQEAGQKLAQALKDYALDDNVFVLALPRGGVPVAFEVANALSAPLDVFIVRKLGVPGHQELAMGAIGTGNVVVYNEDIIKQLHISQLDIAKVLAQEKAELARRELIYRGGKPYPDLVGKTVILVDDGIATGATMRAAVAALRALHPAKIILAVPCADHSLIQSFASLVDVVICPLQPTQFHAVGAWYMDFAQTEDEEVHQLLNKAARFVSNSH